MATIDLTTTAPAARRPGATARSAAIAAAITAGVLLLAGGAALAGDTLRDGDGFFTSPREPFSTETYAIAMKSVDVSDAPRWAFGDLGLDTVRVRAESDRPLFLGIARADDVERYLAGIEHDDVSELGYHPFDVDYDRTEGDRAPTPPAEEPIWVAATQARGEATLEWEPAPGDWRAVMMNADGSRAVSAEVELGARTDLLRWVGAALLGAGLLAAGAAGILRAAARTRR